jgi:Cu(I)/Ag(I) efflux system membrane protein CusA/SilA
MVGGMITAPLLSMLVVPVAYLLLRRPRVPRAVGTPYASSFEGEMK